MQQLKNLSRRIKKLEIDNDISNKQLAFLSELVNTLKQTKNGKQIYNKTLNHYHLNYLLHSVLPRRKRQLLEIESDESIPNNIKSIFINNELKLIKSTTKTISHRHTSKKNLTHAREHS